MVSGLYRPLNLLALPSIRTLTFLITQINKNGLLSFGGNVSSLDHKISDLPPFIAGFWSDISFANENSVIGITERNHSLSQHNITKACITQLLREGFGGSMAGFKLTDFIIVTWKDAAHSDSDKVSSSATSVLIELCTYQHLSLSITCTTHTCTCIMLSLVYMNLPNLRID